MIYQITPISNNAISGLIGQNPGSAPALFAKFFAALVGLMLLIGTLWAFFQLLWGGLSWISSGGDKTQVESSRNRIFQAIIGLVIVFASWAIYLMLMQFLGISPVGSNGTFQFILPSFF